MELEAEVSGGRSLYPAIRAGEYGDYTITKLDWWRVVVYRTSLSVASLSFIVGSLLFFHYGPAPSALLASNYLFAVFSLGIGVSLLTIRIYLALLHRLLLIFWLLGSLSAITIALTSPASLFVTAYEQPLALLGIGFIFGSLTGIFMKEAFCHAQTEAILLTPLVPALFVIHANDLFSVSTERWLLGIWTFLYTIFFVRKFFQEIEPEIGDKT
ncbi:MAG: hypothetical protein GY794_01555, partial [bacterium]|nr:hypothetical protein [bacterium]